MFRNIISLLLFIQVYAIPQDLRKPFELPKDFKFSNGNTLLIDPVENLLTLDDACKQLYKPWWKIMRDQRHLVHLDRLEHPDRYINSPLPLHYIDFSYDDVPVQGIWAKAIVPSLRSMFTADLYSCSGACQDIRPTIEWLLSSHFNDRPQRRVRRNVYFPCPRGYKSKTVSNLSRRRTIPSTRESEAIELMTKPRLLDGALIPYITHPPSSLEIVGDAARQVTGCHCVPMTNDEQNESLRQVHIAKNKASRRAELKRTRPDGLPKRAYKRKKDPGQASSSDEDLQFQPEHEEKNAELTSDANAAVDDTEDDSKLLNLDEQTEFRRHRVESPPTDLPDSEFTAFLQVTLDSFSTAPSFDFFTGSSGGGTGS